MRILKYTFLLLILFSLAFVVFVATQPGDYKIIRSKEIAISKDILYNLVSDSTALKDWTPWNEKQMSLKNENLSSSDTLAQQITLNNKVNKSLFIFKNTKKGTLVSWQLEGEMDFKEKLLNTLQGGVHNVIGNKLVDGLKNIDQYLGSEFAAYTIKIEGLVTKHATNYIQQIDTCSIADFQKESKRLLQNMMSFVENNEIIITGLPFITFKTWNKNDKTTIFAMCVPVEEEILTTDGSEISGGHFDEFLAVKANLTGDYSHKQEAWDKAYAYIKEKNLIEEINGTKIEVYKISLPKERKPSKWVTEIYIPVQKKVYQPKVVKPTIIEDVKPTTLEKPVSNTELNN